MSERDGYNHLYLYTIGGNLIKQVTKGKFEVKDFLGWDKPTNTFYYTSNEESPLRTAYTRPMPRKDYRSFSPAPN